MCLPLVLNIRFMTMCRRPYVRHKLNSIKERMIFMIRKLEITTVKFESVFNSVITDENLGRYASVLDVTGIFTYDEIQLLAKGNYVVNDFRDYKLDSCNYEELLETLYDRYAMRIEAYVEQFLSDSISSAEIDELNAVDKVFKRFAKYEGEKICAGVMFCKESNLHKHIFTEAFVGMLATESL